MTSSNSEVSCQKKRPDNAPWVFQVRHHLPLSQIVCQTHQLNLPQQDAPIHVLPPAQKSAVSYPPPRGVPWKCISAIMGEDKSCPGCHYNHPKYYPRLKLHQEVGCLALAKHGYLCRKDVTASENVVYQFNTKSLKILDQSCTRKSVAKRVSDDKASDHVSARRVHPPSILSPPLDSIVPPALIRNNLILPLKQDTPMPTSNGYANIHSSGSEDELVFEEMVSSKL